MCVHVHMHLLTISLSIDGALIEAHDVLGQSSSLVTEDVLNLKEKKKQAYNMLRQSVKRPRL